MKKNYMKKTLAVALTAAVLAPASFVEAAQFKDVSANHWAYQFIEDMSDQGVIKGYVDKTYKPERQVQFLEVLNLIKGVINPSADDLANARAKYGADVKDLEVPEWAEDAVLTALEKDVLSLNELKEAKNAGMVSYQPTRIPDRSSVAVYYARALNLDKKEDTGNLKYKDMDKISKDVKEYLAALVDAGIFEATGADGNFQGDRGIRRDEMAKITYLSRDYKKNKKTDSFIYGCLTGLGTKEDSISLFYTNSRSNVDFKKGSVKYDKVKEFEIPKDAKVTIYGKDAKLSDIGKKDIVELKFVNDKIKEVKVYPENAYVEGRVTQVAGRSSVNKEITLRLPNGEEETFYVSRSDFDLPRTGENVKYKLNYLNIAETKLGEDGNYIGKLTDYSSGRNRIELTLADGTSVKLDTLDHVKIIKGNLNSGSSFVQEPEASLRDALRENVKIHVENGKVTEIKILDDTLRKFDGTVTVESVSISSSDRYMVNIEAKADDADSSVEKVRFSISKNVTDAIPVRGARYKILGLVTEDGYLVDYSTFDLIGK